MNFLTQLIHDINNNNVALLENSLNILSDKIDKMKSDMVNPFIMILLKEAVKNNRAKCVELLIRFFALKYYPNNLISPLESSTSSSIMDIPEDEISDKITKMLLSLIVLPSVEKTVLRYCFILLKVNFVDILMELLFKPDSSSVGYLINMIDITGEPKLEDLIRYQNLCKEHENYLLVDFFKAKINKINDYQEIPNYMYNFLLPDDLPTEEEAKNEIENILIDLNIAEQKIKDNIDSMSNMELAIILTSGIGVQYFDVNKQQEIRNAVLNQLQTLSKQEKIDKIDPFLINLRIEKLRENLTVFRILGPIHQVTGINYEKDDIYKHCMFSCDYYDYDEDLDIYMDWFVGNCNYCSKKIRRRVHAVREPQFEGGWKGCFCSWRCVYDNYLELPNKEFGIKEMISEYSKRIEKFGIQDQLPDEIIREMEKIDKSREARNNPSVSFGWNSIPVADRELVAEAEVFEIRKEDEYEQENEIKLDDILFDHYVFGRVKIDQEFDYQGKSVQELENVIPISPVISNSLLVLPDLDEMDKLSIQSNFIEQKPMKKSVEITLPE